MYTFKGGFVDHGTSFEISMSGKFAVWLQICFSPFCAQKISYSFFIDASARPVSKLNTLTFGINLKRHCLKQHLPILDSGAEVDR